MIHSTFYPFQTDHQEAVLLERSSAAGLHLQGPVQDQSGQPAQVRLPRPGVPERLLGQGPAGGPVQRGQRGLLLGGQEGPGVLPHEQLQPHAVLQRRRCLRAPLGSDRRLRPHQGSAATG